MKYFCNIFKMVDKQSSLRYNKWRWEGWTGYIIYTIIIYSVYYIFNNYLINYGGRKMGLNKAIIHGKEKRKPYRGAKAYDRSCRNHDL